MRPSDDFAKQEENEKNKKPREVDQDISILDLLENDFDQKKDTVYKETMILAYRITPDDMWKKSQVDSLVTEIADPFFYGVIEANIGKCFHFTPIKLNNNAYLLKEVEPDNAKFMVRYLRYRLDIEIKSFGEWKIVLKNDPITSSRYFGISKKLDRNKLDPKVCFIVLDVLNLPTRDFQNH
ncbi:hypothetical protein ACFL27_00440 [candidate division CSSED10-310 bacterium]|uniref:Uncharacterized protein n=1 Tax=candidate division CSSED10-310 bacterium TaxID=2855610 RepID=A0ABV6YR20_UNCC1